MKRLLTAAVLMACGASSSLAADMAMKAPAYKAAAPMVAIYGWTGFYVGVNGGGAFGQTGASENGLAPIAAISAGDYILGHNVSGGFGGGQFGYNWQVDKFWVLGAEVDYQGADIKGTASISGATVAQRNGAFGLPTNFVTTSERIDSFGTARLRVGGLVTPEMLIYATGGAAWGTVKYNGQFHIVANDYIGSDSSTRFGYSAGAGIEYKFSPNWSVKGEYLYVDLGKHSLITTQNAIVTSQSQFNYSTHFSIARVGLNYQFGGPVVAKY